jgi:sulfoxide reductase catalytic subunit YedY
VLAKKIGYDNGVVRAKRPKRLPVVLTREEVRSVFGLLQGLEWIMGTLLYGAGLRLMECMRLRVKDVDFSRNEMRVRSGKGDKDRRTVLPETRCEKGARLFYYNVMWTRRKLLRMWFWASLSSLVFHPLSICWAKAKQILPKGFSKSKLKDMNPAEIDSRNLEVDPLKKFGTMGPTDVVIDLKTYRLKVTGKVERPLSLSYDEILKYPSLTETVLLICPGFFSNNGRWTGVNLKSLLQEAQIKKVAQYVDIVGAHEKRVRIPLKALDQKRIFLAYRVNGEALPQKHGFPLRLVYEDAYGSDWVKYVDEIVIS